MKTNQLNMSMIVFPSLPSVCAPTYITKLSLFKGRELNLIFSFHKPWNRFTILCEILLFPNLFQCEDDEPSSLLSWCCKEGHNKHCSLRDKSLPNHRVVRRSTVKSLDTICSRFQLPGSPACASCCLCRWSRVLSRWCCWQWPSWWGRWTAFLLSVLSITIASAVHSVKLYTWYRLHCCKLSMTATEVGESLLQH